MGKHYLNVDGKKVLTTEITYEDLVMLYKQYIEKFNEVPVFSKCTLKNNMPQGRIINKIISNKGITYNDFLLQFGKVSHVRTESKDYDYYVNRFIKLCSDHVLKIQDLINNEYGLPNANWFIKYCPDKNVKTYNDFIKWCGLKENDQAFDKNYISDCLVKLQNELQRPITQKDITKKSVGFSMIVIKRLFGSLTKAKRELGLEKTKSKPINSFEYYKNNLDESLKNIKKFKNRNYISWADIENPLYCKNTINHKTIKKAFERENIDIFSYIKSKGFHMNPSNFSFHYTFDDGERVVSTMEYDVSLYLKSKGLKYNVDYFRDVMYKTFANINSKINCDYKIIVNGTPLYLEVAGIIYNCNNKEWKNIIYSSNQENNYKDKMIKKEKLLKENKCEYLFLFKDNFEENDYKNLIENKFKTLKGSEK